MPIEESLEVKVLVSLARVETKLDTVLTGQVDHESRIRNLEDKTSSPLRAYAVPLSMLASVMCAVLAGVSVLLR